MKTIKYIRSYFVSAEKEIRIKYFDELIKLRDGLKIAFKNDDPYQSVLELIKLCQDRTDFFLGIKYELERVNYGQHDFAIKTLEKAADPILNIGAKSAISLGKSQYSEASFSNTFIRLENKPGFMTLQSLKSQDEMTIEGNLDFNLNGEEIKKFVISKGTPAYSNLSTLITLFKE